MEIAAHCAGYSGGFASIISAGKFPSRVEDFLGPIQSAIDSITTLEQATTMLRRGIADTMAALSHTRASPANTRAALSPAMRARTWRSPRWRC